MKYSTIFSNYLILTYFAIIVNGICILWSPFTSKARCDGNTVKFENDGQKVKPSEILFKMAFFKSHNNKIIPFCYRATSVIDRQQQAKSMI